MQNAYEMFKISKKIQSLVTESEIKLKEIYKKIDDIAFENQAKVLKAFQNNKISQMHLMKTTGYGYNDVGRESIEKIYSEVFECEDALVRVQFVNGTHALSTALYALLMPGDTLLSISGRPYDTLHQVIGIEENSHSLKNYGVKYDEISLLSDGNFDIEKIKEYILNNKVKVIEIQRSKGYSFRKSLSVEDIQNVINEIKKIDKDIIIMVDNCYGEFVEKTEPTNVGADVVVGSLIKNIGGGLCETGAYIVGRKDLIQLCSERLTCPGIGKECGATLDQNRNILQGLFLSPSVVKNAVKSATLCSCMLDALGFETLPKYNEKRTDIIQAIKFNDEDLLIKFIQGIQYASPVDSQVTPYPWDMPGYSDKVIMAAGTFVEGASIELSADSPIRPPYVAYMQGGLTYESAKIAICNAISNALGE